MTHASSTSRADYCSALRHELDGLADRVAVAERRSGDRAAVVAELEAQLREAEALLARTEFADPDAWRELADRLDEQVAQLRRVLAA